MNGLEALRRGGSTRQAGFYHGRYNFNELRIIWLQKFRYYQLHKRKKVRQDLHESDQKTISRVGICLIRKGNEADPVAPMAIWMVEVVTKDGKVGRSQRAGRVYCPPEIKSKIQS
jgi:hypothetical protein